MIDIFTGPQKRREKSAEAERFSLVHLKGDQSRGPLLIACVFLEIKQTHQHKHTHAYTFTRSLAHTCAMPKGSRNASQLAN